MEFHFKATSNARTDAKNWVLGELLWWELFVCQKGSEVVELSCLALPSKASSQQARHASKLHTSEGWWEWAVSVQRIPVPCCKTLSKYPWTFTIDWPKRNSTLVSDIWWQGRIFWAVRVVSSKNELVLTGLCVPPSFSDTSHPKIISQHSWSLGWWRQSL